jgi:CubicO group peptidase (beta-lactamase class C family)
MSMTLTGHIDPRFAPVKDIFAAALANGAERGVRFSVVIDNEVVIDLMGGVMDREGVRAFDAATLTPIFSTGKTVMAVLIARLVDQGKLDYEAPVARYLPAFGAAGKAAMTVGQLISHQGGLCGFIPPQEPTVWFDPQKVVELLCAQAPLWPIGEGSGYHPITGGYLLNALHKVVDGRTLGDALREDFATPFGLDLMIGAAESEFGRIADIQKPPAMPYLGEIDVFKRAAFLDAGSAPGGRGTAAWRKMEIPSANMHATALSLAQFMSLIANGGVLMGRPILSDHTFAQLTRERCFGMDRVLARKLSWGAGLLRNKGLGIFGPNDQAVGHAGWGGSAAFADPDKKLSAAYVMNKQSPHLLGDPRPTALFNALYACL